MTLSNLQLGGTAGDQFHLYFKHSGFFWKNFVYALKFSSLKNQEMSAIEELRMTILQGTSVFSPTVQVTLAQENVEELNKVLFLVNIFYGRIRFLLKICFFFYESKT